ncbi:hypothetical protein KP509_10G009900 [Ceratopteris richardii]|uniref:RING-type E3 ubiquitin transferase n=1 Tax=Ceratopteris richardii TaxID=49495 RepID=A0A8T2TZ42_CERRI|nr:hypothetical protein KP509_10G009900 [Ceratopteris richardii]
MSSASYSAGQSSSLSSDNIPDLLRFLCNICEDVCFDPVLTACGHLFCWPCLYHSCISLQTAEGGGKASCPVCQQSVCSKIIPLYGCGRTPTPDLLSKKFPGKRTPCRPPPLVVYRPPAISSASSFDSEIPVQQLSMQQHEGRNVHHHPRGMRPTYHPSRAIRIQDVFYFLISRFSVRPSHLRAQARRRFCNEKEYALQWSVILFVLVSSIAFLVS